MSSGDFGPPATFTRPAPTHSSLETSSISTDAYAQIPRQSSSSSLRRVAESSSTPTGASDDKRDIANASSAPRKRISRACDACNSLRTKCNGDLPCNHCTEFGISCTYLRQRKKRGKASRKDLAAQQALLDASTTGTQTHTPPTPRHPTDTVSRYSPIHHEATTLRSLPRPAPTTELPPSPAAPPTLSHYHSHGSESAKTAPQQRHPGFPVLQPDAGRSQPDDPIEAPQRYRDRFQHQTSDRPLLQTFNDFSGVPNTSSHSLPSPSSQGGGPLSGTFNKPVGSPLFNGVLGPSPFPYSPGRVELPSPRGAFNLDFQPSSKSNQWLRYPVLIPILPRITALIPVSLACDLLDIYFSSLTPTVTQPASPYILAFTLRKKSVLRAENPRPCSKALLVAMLWVGAHTCEASFLTSPPSQRAKVCNQLLELSISLLNPLVHVPSQSPFPTRNGSGGNITPFSSFGGANLAARSDESGGLAGGAVTLDDVMTYSTIATVVSASEFKAASLRWWTAAFTVARELKLGKELPDPSSGAQYDGTGGVHGQNGREAPDIYSSRDKETITGEAREERRRTWWLLYSVDRHLALCYNRPLHLRDAECQNLLQPDPDVIFQAGDFYPADMAGHALRPRGPCVECTGHGMFGYFLPLMTILGHIVDLNFAKQHPIYGRILKESDGPERHVAHITSRLEQYGASLARLQAESVVRQPNGNMEADEQTKTVVAYGTHLMHTLHVAIYGRWDPIALLDDDDLWISSTSFVTATQHAVAAAEAIGEILEYDPDLSFMPFFFGIYLLQGSFLLLLIADKLRDEANPSVVRACETIVRAHEVCVVTLNTEYQRNFRNVMRSALAQVKGRMLEDAGAAEKKRREVLALYRWTGDGTGLAL